ncbi:MAG: hypothetical protein ACYSTS_19305 [Planctomycetota bacterium]|jgi:hypothetical protein
MKEYTLSFCKFIKHNESLLEVIIDNAIDINTVHANEANDLLSRIFKKPYGVLVDVRNDFSFIYEGGVTIGNPKMEKRVALLAHRKRSEIALRSVIRMQNAGFPKKDL